MSDTKSPPGKACLGLMLVAGALITGISLPARADVPCGEWSSVQSPSPGAYSGLLNDVASAGPQDAWADEWKKQKLEKVAVDFRTGVEPGSARRRRNARRRLLGGWLHHDRLSHQLDAAGNALA